MSNSYTILFLAANPTGMDQLRLDREARAIQLELDRARRRDLRLVTRWAVTPLDLLHELRTLKPHVVHFCGHGHSAGSASEPTTEVQRDFEALSSSTSSPAGALVLVGASGEAQPVAAEAIAQAFGAAESAAKLVVLNACYTDSYADSLLEYVPCVVGMSGAVGDESARNFAIGLYGGLGAGASFAGAFKQGRAAIDLQGLPHSELPQLRTKPSIDADSMTLAELPWTPQASRVIAAVAVLVLLTIVAFAKILWGGADHRSGVSRSTRVDGGASDSGSTAGSSQGSNTTQRGSAARECGAGVSVASCNEVQAGSNSKVEITGTVNITLDGSDKD